MRTLPALLAATLFSAWAQTYTAETFAAEIERVQGALDSAPLPVLAQALPASWDVQTPSERYLVSADRLRELLAPSGDRPAPEGARREQARGYLTELEQHVLGSATARGGNPAQERAALNEILARSEFKGVRPPSDWDLFLERVLGWLDKLLNRILSFASQYPTTSQIVFWTVLALGVTALGAWLYRLWTRGEKLGRISERTDPQPGGRSWREWMLAARKASRHGDPREAIHCAYWTGVARLQEDRLLPARLSKTPRECVRMISGPPLEPLRGLTLSLERFWYASGGPAASDVDESFRHLESLGCKVD